MTQMKFNKQLISFLTNSVSPFHCVAESKLILKNAGFSELKEYEKWILKDGQSYFVTRNNSSLIAFVYRKNFEKEGFRITGAHTDSPCLKLKPVQDMIKDNYFQLSTEVYGGPVLSTWFDRDLSIAGKVCFSNGKNKLETALIDFKDPVAIIPNLAIHLSGKKKISKNRRSFPRFFFNLQKKRILRKY
jgi:aspartyl aminopeptidase